MSGITPTQAVLSYDAPDAGACRVEVSESPSYSPLAADVDPVLFPGSNLDTRAGALSAGRQRIFVAGKHGMNAASASNPFLGADGRRHSRALQAGTAHYYRVTCGASSITGSFTTPLPPRGSTYGEVFPADGSRPGAYNWPDFRPGDRAERSVDPVTGALIRKITVDEDLTPFNSAWTSAGAFSMCSHVPVGSGGDTYYLCSIPSSYAGMLVSIDTATGDVLPLTSLVVPWESMGNDARLSCGTVAFDGAVPTQFYCIQTVSGKQSLLLGEWTGPVNAARSGINQLTPDPLLRWTNLTPAPNDLTSLLAAFDPLFTPAQQRNVPYYMIVGQQKGKIIARLLANQDASGWIVVLDPGNKRALGAGGTGGTAAALPVWNAPASRWCGLHTVIGAGDGNPWISAVVNTLTVARAYLGGPYRVAVSGPGGAIGPADKAFTISPTGGLYEPASANPTEPAGYLMDAQPGDLFFFDVNGSGSFEYSVDEMVELVAKNPVTHTWTVRRGNQMAGSPFYAGTGLTLWSNIAASVPAGTPLYAACRTESLAIKASATLWWNFETDPHGRNATLPAASGLTSPEVIEHTHTGAHEVTRDERSVMADNGCFGPWNACWVSWSQTGSVPGLTTVGSPTYSNAIPTFSGVMPPGGSNTYQQHPGYEQVNAPPTERSWFLDRMPLVSGGAAYGLSELVPGTASVYKVATSPLHRDKVGTLASCGAGILRDISGPAAGEAIGDAAPYTYCVAVRAGECRPGAAPGDVYVSCPAANYRVGGDAASTVRCASWTLQPGQVDICVGDVWPYANSVVQAGFGSTQPNGELNRVITQGFARYHEPGSEYDNSIATPDGAWAMFSSNVSGNGLAYLAKIPPQPAAPETVRRDGFVSVPLNLKPAAGLAGVHNAVVQFGYLENGSATDYFCTSRREACVKGAQPGDAYAWAGDGAAGQPCASGCTVAIPLIPGRVAWFRALYRDAANNPLAAGETGVASESGPVFAAAPTPVSLAPAATRLAARQSVQLHLSDDRGEVAAKWSIAPPLGAISSIGLYTAPELVPAGQTITVTAVDLSDSQRVAAATVTLLATVPMVDSLSPASGTQGTGVAVTLTGRGFSNGVVVSVSGIGITVSGVSVIDSTHIAATFNIAASAPPGPVNVTVAGSTSSVPFTVMAAGPVLAAVIPATGTQGTAVAVTLTGSGFSNGVVVSVSGIGITVSGVSVIDSTHIAATFNIAASAPPGPVNVTVAGSTSSVPFTVMAAGPVLAAVIPATGTQGTAVAVTLTGRGFSNGAVVSVSGTGVTVSSVSVIDSTHIVATFNIAASAPPGPVNVTVAGSTSSVPFTVTAAGPVLAAVSPASGTQGTAVAVTLTGSGFSNGVVVSVSGTGITVSGVSVLGSSRIAAVFTIAATATPGLVNIAVSSGGRVTATVPFTIAPPAPVLSSISPAAAQGGQSVAVVLSGSGFAPGARLVFSGSGIAPGPITVVSANRIEVTLTLAAAARSRNIALAVSMDCGNSGTALFAVLPGAKLNGGRATLPAR